MLLAALVAAPPAAQAQSRYPRLKVADLSTGKVSVATSGVYDDIVWADPLTLLGVMADDQNRPYDENKSPDLMRIQPGATERTLEPMPNTVGSLVFAPDGSGYLAISGTRRGVDIVHHAMDGTVRARLFSFGERESVFLGLSWSRSTRYAALSTTRRVVVVDTTTGEKVTEVRVGRDNGAGTPAFSPDERTLIGFDGMRLVRVDLQDGTVRRLARRRYWRVAWSSAGHLAAIRWNGQQIDLLSPDTGRPMRAAVGRLEAWTMAWSPDGRRLAYSFSRYDGWDGLGIYDVERARRRTVHKPIFNTISFLRWSPDGRRLAWQAGG